MAGRALILQHERASIGSVPEWASARGFEVEVLMADEEWSPPALDTVEFVVSMGSAAHTYQEVSWLAREYEVLAAAEAGDVPILGICFGSQSLAVAHGGTTRPASEHEVDWLEVETLAPELIPAGPWMFWHEDSFELPPDAELLARTPVGPAAFRSGRSLAVQFHPEATPAAMDNWLGAYRDELDPAVAERLRRGMDAEPEQIVARAYALYDTFLALAGIQAPAPA
ncbi:MAG: gamma-glutamyl-gamma-aminobutyrate hydrolase family protein [Solirubrobacterales bacterium]